MQPTLNIALRAARIASEQIARAVERLDIIKSEQQSVAEFVTEVCLAAEKVLAANIHKANASHKVVGVYSGEVASETETNDDVEWFINPIDGLTNFAKGLPWFALTVVCREKGRIEHTVVLNPMTGEEFTASRGRGAQLNGRRIRVSSLTDFKGAVIGADLTSNKQLERFQSVFGTLTELGADVQNCGSCSLTLAYVAAGRLDGCCLLGMPITELEPGRLLIQEAGGLTGDFSGNAKLSERSDLLAANPKLFKQLLKDMR